MHGFIDIMTAEYMFGTSITVDPFDAENQYGIISATMQIAFQTFIVAHEYSHYVDGHLGLPYLN